MDHPYYSVCELAQVLRTSEKWLYQQLAKGKIPGAFKLGGLWFIDRALFVAGLSEKAKKPPKGR